MKRATDKRPAEHRVGNLTIINRSRKPFDAQEIIDALNANTGAAAK